LFLLKNKVILNIYYSNINKNARESAFIIVQNLKTNQGNAVATILQPRNFFYINITIAKHF